MIVLDASVAVKAFLPEEHSEEAANLLAGVEAFLAPSLIHVEVGAAITARVRRLEIDAASAHSAWHRWNGVVRRGRIAMSPNEELMDEAVELACRLAHPLQDCLYLAMASRLHVPLLTADAKFVARAAKQFSQVALFPRPQ